MVVVVRPSQTLRPCHLLGDSRDPPGDTPSDSGAPDVTSIPACHHGRAGGVCVSGGGEPPFRRRRGGSAASSSCLGGGAVCHALVCPSLARRASASDSSHAPRDGHRRDSADGARDPGGRVVPPLLPGQTGREPADSPSRSTPTDRPRQAGRLARPRRPGRPGAPPARGGHLSAAAADADAAAALVLPRLRTPQRLQQGLRDASLSGSSAEAEPGLPPIPEPHARLGPSPRLPRPANPAAVAKATAWRQGSGLTSAESVRASERASERAGSPPPAA